MKLADDLLKETLRVFVNHCSIDSIVMSLYAVVREHANGEPNETVATRYHEMANVLWNAALKIERL